MSEQIIDLRSTWATLRRRSGVLLVATSLGAGVAGAVAYVSPLSYSSTSIVLLPPPQGANAPAQDHTIETQVQIANSEAVLGPAGRAVSPELTAAEAADRVEVIAPTTDVLSISASGATAASAEALSEAVANAEVAYLKAAASALGEDARATLSDRSQTLKASLESVNREITKTQARLGKEPATSAAGKADAAALAQLTARQADLVLQVDQIEAESSAGAQPLNGQAGGGARVIQQASPAVSTPFVVQALLYAAIGGAVAFLLTSIVIVLRGRRERSLRSRDEIADAIGIPVVASIRSRGPRSVGEWTSLLQNYAPDGAEMWTLRRMLRLVTPGANGSLAGEPKDSGKPASVVVITLAGDTRALAIGPQLASSAASMGTATRLVLAQQHETGNRLWAACSGMGSDARPRKGLAVGGLDHGGSSADLVVHVAVMDREHPHLGDLGAADSVTLFAVSSGAATADDLARVAIVADDAGHAIERVVVVDPDALDRTTGRLVTERIQHGPLPSLMTGSSTTGEATPLETRRSSR